MTTLIAVPSMDTVPVQFCDSLFRLRKPVGTAYAIKAGSLVYDARNTFVANAIDKGMDRILWIDSDMVFPPDTMERLSKDLDEGRDMVCGLCFKRHVPTVPVIYKRLEYRKSEGVVKAEAECWLDYPKDKVFEIQGCGFGCVMVKTEVLQKVWEKHGPPFDPMTQIGEDLACCLRIRDLGYRMYCDSRIKIGHVGVKIFDEETYLEGRNG